MYIISTETIFPTSTRISPLLGDLSQQLWTTYKFVMRLHDLVELGPMWALLLPRVEHELVDGLRTVHGRRKTESLLKKWVPVHYMFTNPWWKEPCSGSMQVTKLKDCCIKSAHVKTKSVTVSGRLLVFTWHCMDLVLFYFGLCAKIIGDKG